MPSLFKSAAALAMAGVAVANPLIKRDDACLAAVTGKAALGDDSLRKEHCSSFIKTIVTSAPITVTTTITDAPAPSNWKRDVIVCPNEVPNYASACNESGYKSACAAWGVTGETTITIPASTTTKTVYAPKTCPTGAVSTVTVTSAVDTTTVSVGTVTVTATNTITETTTVGSGVGPTGTGSSFPGSNSTLPSKCISDAQATEFAGAFKDLLEYTSYNGTQGPAGRGYHQDVSDKYLATDFADYSDSINWMAGIPEGSVTFPNKIAFDQGQGYGQPELTVTDLNIEHGCNTVTWRWRALTSSYATVTGVNLMVLTEDLTQIQTNYAEFNNAEWLYSFGLQCKVSSSTSNSTTSTGGSRRLRY